MNRPVKTVRLNLAGSVLFGAVLFGIGFALKKFVVDAGIMSGSDADTMAKVAIGVMVLGGIIVVGNIAWVIFCVSMGKRQAR